jgi:hypothetical protein
MCEGMAVVVCPLSVVSFDRRGFVATGVNLMRRENQVNRSYQLDFCNYSLKRFGRELPEILFSSSLQEDLIHTAGTPSKNHPVF